VLGEMATMAAKVAPIVVSMVGGPEAVAATAAAEAAFSAVKGDFVHAGLNLAAALPGVGALGSVGEAIGEYVPQALQKIPFEQLTGAAVSVGKGDFVGAGLSLAGSTVLRDLPGLSAISSVRSGGTMPFFGDLLGKVTGFFQATPAPDLEDVATEDINAETLVGQEAGFLSFLKNAIPAPVQGAMDKVAGWFGAPSSVDVHDALESLASDVAGSALSGIMAPKQMGAASSRLPGTSPKLPGSETKFALGRMGNAMLPEPGYRTPLMGGGDSAGAGAGREGWEIDLPGGVPAVTGSGGNMACGCPMPQSASLATQRNAILCALSQKIGFRIRPKDFYRLTSLGPAFLVLAQAMGLDAQSLLLLLISAKRRGRRARGISARDIRTTRRVGHQFRALQHALSGVAPRAHHGRSNVIPFRRRRRRAA
jgi:hypothetical protein